MENTIRTIGYGIILAISAVYFWFLHSHFYFLILVVMVVAPFLSLLMAYYLKRKVTVCVEALSDGYGNQRGTNYFRIKVNNPTLLVCLDAKLSISVANTFLGQSGTKLVSVPIRAKKGYELEWPVTSDYPGLLQVKVDSIKIKDLMGFWNFKKEVDAKAEIGVMPEMLSDVSFEAVNLEQGMLESEESQKKGNDFSDVQEIREYIPGDKLMSIHWKLSAKRDILMVKDRVSMSDKQLVIVPELTKTDFIVLGQILSLTYTAIMHLIEEKTTVRLMYFSMNRYEYEDIRIDYKEDVKSAFEKMFYETLYEGYEEAASHMALVHPEMKAFLHVTFENGSVGLYVRENG